MFSYVLLLLKTQLLAFVGKEGSSQEQAGRDMKQPENSGDTTDPKPFSKPHDCQKNNSAHEEICFFALPQWLEPLFFGGFLEDVEREALYSQMGRQFSKLIEEEVSKTEARKKSAKFSVPNYGRNKRTRKPASASKPIYKVRRTHFRRSREVRFNVQRRKIAETTLTKNKRHRLGTTVRHPKKFTHPSASLNPRSPGTHCSTHTFGPTL